MQSYIEAVYSLLEACYMSCIPPDIPFTKATSEEADNGVTLRGVR